MLDESSDQQLLAAWKRGDEASADLLFRRYQTRLMALVRSRLSRKLARRVDAEDIVLSAYRSFFITARRSDVSASFSDTVWNLLTTIALRKLSHQARRHLAGRRSVDAEQQHDFTDLQLDIAHEPTVEHAAVIADQVKQILRELDPTVREVFILTMQGHDPSAVAVKLNCHERTIRRALQRIRRQFPNEKLDFPLTAIISDHRETFSTKTDTIPHEGTARYQDYLLKQFVGGGAFSKVYRAIEQSTGLTVAIKFLKKDCQYDPRASASLLREYELLKQLKHPHVLSIQGWGTTPRRALFLVSEFIDGANLEVWMRRVSSNIQQLIQIVRQVAEAVAAAHSHGILHGDIKPANVLMGKNGRVVLCDFGFARYASAPDDVPRGGTAGFLAPEQICDQFGSISERTDVYGLGGLMYALLSGLPPMPGRDLPETLANILSSLRPEKPSAISPHSYPALDDFVLLCLAKEPSQRPASAEEVVRKLADLDASVPSHSNVYSTRPGSTESSG